MYVSPFSCHCPRHWYSRSKTNFGVNFFVIVATLHRFRVVAQRLFLARQIEGNISVCSIRVSELLKILISNTGASYFVLFLCFIFNFFFLNLNLNFFEPRTQDST